MCVNISPSKPIKTPSSHFFKKLPNAWTPCPWCPCDPQWPSEQTHLTIHDLCNWPCFFRLSQPGPGPGDIRDILAELEMETLPPFLWVERMSKQATDSNIQKNIQAKLDQFYDFESLRQAYIPWMVKFKSVL